MKFLGRECELDLLRKWLNNKDYSQLTVVYGRRRVGKTRLVEEAYKDIRLLSFEGLEGQSSEVQKGHFLSSLAKISGRKEHALIKNTSWADILILVSEYIGRRPVVLLLDELQWMAAGRTDLVSSLKYVWDNYFQKNNKVNLILCGSISSFLVKKVVRSKALYGRVDLEIHLQPLTIDEIKPVFIPKRSLRETVELYISIGGVPQYLKMVTPSISIHLNLERMCFSPHGYLIDEFDRIFASHFGKNKHYKQILITLAKNRHTNRSQLLKACNLDPGGRLSEYLEELELADFIESYSPIEKPESERLKRYRIKDPYLLFYFRFIYPSLRKIKQMKKVFGMTHFVSDKAYAIWRGLAFEYFCYHSNQLIADSLGFGSVKYDCGSYFSRSDQKTGLQVDLLFIRADHVMTLCEIKFQDAKIGKDIIPEVERKIEKLPNPKAMTIEKVLITASDITDDLHNEGYFNRILMLNDLV